MTKIIDIDIDIIREQKAKKDMEKSFGDIAGFCKELLDYQNHLLIDRVFDSEAVSVVFSNPKNPCGREFYFTKDNKRKLGMILVNVNEKGEEIYNNVITQNISDRILVVDKWDNDTISITYDEIVNIDKNGDLSFKPIIDKNINMTKYQCGKESLSDIPEYLYDKILYILGTIFE